MKILIIYQSTHHGNTYKFVDAIEEKICCDTINIFDNKIHGNNIVLQEYDLIGIASGIAFGKFYNLIEEWIKNNLPSGKKVFLLYTYGMKSNNYIESISEIVTNCGSELAGSYGCLGYDTYGLMKLIGGIAKGHPNDGEIEEAVQFVKKICMKLYNQIDNR